MRKYFCIMMLLVPCALCKEGVDGGREKIRENARTAATYIHQGSSDPDRNTSPGWHKISGTTLKGGSVNVSPCPPNNYGGYGYPFADGCQAVYNAWSSAIADTARNRLIIWGGGHGDYAGNETYSLELSTNPPTLIRLNPPSPPNTSNSPCPSPEALSDGRPNSRHTYDGLVYLPNQDEMLVQGGGVGTCGYGSTATWTLSLGSMLASCSPNCSSNWTLQHPRTPSLGALNQITAYDGVNNLAWENDQNFLWSYDPVANNWTKQYTLPVGDNMHATGVFDPVDQYFINIGSGTQNIVYFSTATRKSHAQINPSVDPSCSGYRSGEFGGAYPGVAWDPYDNVVVIYPNSGNVLYLLNPKTWKCTTETWGSTAGVDYPQQDSSASTGTFKRFNYFPTLDTYVLCNDAYYDCWTLHRMRSRK